MFLKKVCLFLAVAFLIVDIFLFSIYFQARSNLRMLSGEMIENTVLYYESNGVKIDRDAIKSDIPENAIYTFDSENIDVSSNITAQLAKKCFRTVRLSDLLKLRTAFLIPSA